MEQDSGLINKLNLTSGKMGTTSQIFNMWRVLLNDVTCVKHGKKKFRHNFTYFQWVQRCGQVFYK